MRQLIISFVCFFIIGTAQAVEINQRQGLDPRDRLLVGKEMARAYSKDFNSDSAFSNFNQGASGGSQNIGVINQSARGGNHQNASIVVATDEPIINVCIRCNGR